MKNVAPEFYKWFEENLKEDAQFISAYGAAENVDAILYQRDRANLYDRFSREIWQMIIEDTKKSEYCKPFDFLNSRNHVEKIVSDEGCKDFLFLYAVERMVEEFI